MKKRSRKKSLFIVLVAAAFLITACQSSTDSRAETEALKEQIARLEQQISDLEQQQLANESEISTAIENSGQKQASVAQPQGNINTENTQPAQNNTSVENTQPSQNNTSVENAQQPPVDSSVNYSHQSHHTATNPSSQQVNSIDGLTTYTMEELSSMVDAFVAKASAAVPSKAAAQDMEQFFALKQEEKQIDDILDRHEDELEYLYKNQSLTRDAYKQLERELKLLEDKLDDMEDQLEFVFGIDD